MGWSFGDLAQYWEKMTIRRTWIHRLIHIAIPTGIQDNKKFATGSILGLLAI